jgi:broad specificity phosphatase PhoE
MISSTGAIRTLILVRHGLTDWNVEGRYQGRLDIPLNAAGRAQAEGLKAQLDNIAFDIVYSSPLRRAYETAEIIAGSNPIVCDDRLAEIHHGIWQGKTQDEIAMRWPRDWQTWNSDPDQFTPPGGESAAQVELRVKAFIGDMQSQTALCVSHGVVIQKFLSTVLAKPSSAEHVPSNGSLHILSLIDADE